MILAGANNSYCPDSGDFNACDDGGGGGGGDDDDGDDDADDDDDGRSHQKADCKLIGCQ